MDSLMKLFVSFSLLFFSSLLFGEINGVDGSHKHHHHHHHLMRGLIAKKLFVFGDSYVDTGNTRKPHTNSWLLPYGITFPRKPVGRFSDGRVSTDLLAKLMGIKSPIPYIWRDYVGKQKLENGMNFAYGGTGVFTTMSPYPNMTTQIGFFGKLLRDNVYSPTDFSSSVALVSVAGNDYFNYLFQGRPLAEIPTFIANVVKHIETNVRRIHSLGVKKIAIPSLPPLGCVPLFSQALSFEKCNTTLNGLVEYHNVLLGEVVSKLNKETKKSTFVTIDLYKAFTSVIENNGATNKGSTRFETSLRWCCEGDCGKIDENGVKSYILCDDPKFALFWDGLHPTQEGWKSIYSVLSKNLIKSLAKL
ncbi:unnamed protein product [Cochlearia groenlandica]